MSCTKELVHVHVKINDSRRNRFSALVPPGSRTNNGYATQVACVRTNVNAHTKPCMCQKFARTMQTF